MHHIDATTTTDNALRTSTLDPNDVRSTDIVVCNAQPGRHWEACPPHTGRPALGESFTTNGTTITLPRHPPLNTRHGNPLPATRPTSRAKRKIEFQIQTPLITNNHSRGLAQGPPTTHAKHTQDEGGPSGTHSCRTQNPAAAHLLKPPTPHSPPPSPPADSRAAQKRSADDKADDGQPVHRRTAHTHTEHPAPGSAPPTPGRRMAKYW